MTLPPVGNIVFALRRTALLGLVLLPGFLLSPLATVDALMPLKTDSLEVPSSVDFGELQPNEKKTVSLQVRNRMWRAVDLRPVKVDCGCLAVNDLPGRLRPSQTAVAAVSIKAPAQPGAFSRNLVVLPLSDDQPAWAVLATGTVKATVWAEPSVLDLVIGEDSPPEAELNLRHVKDVRIGRLVPTSSDIEVRDLRARDDETKLSVRIKADDRRMRRVGNELLQVYLDGKPSRPILEVPIRWSPPTKIGYVPPRLDLPKFGEEIGTEGKIRRVLALVVPPDRSADDARLEVLVPWVRIAERSSEGSVLRLELEFFGDQMPAKFQQPILSASLPGEPTNQKLFVSGDRD